jgi:hypothetical protein
MPTNDVGKADFERGPSKSSMLRARWEGPTMRWCPVLVLAALMLNGTASEGSAQIQLFGSKKSKTPPQQRVPELVALLKTDTNDHKRSQAAEELRQFDPKDFPEIVPALIDALQTDNSASVRVEAATGLGRLRPVTVPAGQALEKAVAEDANMRVRIQAKASLVYYQLSGYHAPKKGDPPATTGKTTTDEPPLAAGNEQWWKVDKSSPLAPTVPKQMPSGPQPGPMVPVVTSPSATPAPPINPQPSLGSPLTNAPAQAPGWTQVPPAGETGPRLTPPQ